MRWTCMILFLVVLGATENRAIPQLLRKGIKTLLDTKLGVDKWTVALPNGENVEETANIAEMMQKIIIRSENLPDTSNMNNSTVLMDFKKGVLATLFLDTDMGHLCFFTEDQSSFAESVAEIKRRKNAETPIQQGEPITFYALNRNRITNSLLLLRNGGAAVFQMCRRYLDNGNVYEVVKDSTESMKPGTLTASGFVSAIQPGKSVPIIFKMEENTPVNGLESTSSSSVAN